jgi:hypothetical protein
MPAVQPQAGIIKKVMVIHGIMNTKTFHAKTPREDAKTPRRQRAAGDS